MYDVLIIGAGPGGIFSAYELMERKPDLKIAVFEVGHPLEHRKCPIDGDKIKSCIHCKCCSIMSGFGGAGAFSDGKYNITNDFGGTLYEYIGKKTAIELMEYVDGINLRFEPSFIPPQTVRSVSFVFRTACIFWMLRSAIWVRILIMLFWSTSMII